MIETLLMILVGYLVIGIVIALSLVIYFGLSGTSKDRTLAGIMIGIGWLYLLICILFESKQRKAQRKIAKDFDNDFDVHP